MSTDTRIAYSLEEAAKQVELSASYLRRAVHANELVAKRVGQKFRISHTDLVEWFQNLPDA